MFAYTKRKRVIHLPTLHLMHFFSEIKYRLNICLTFTVPFHLNLHLKLSFYPIYAFYVQLRRCYSHTIKHNYHNVDRISRI